MKMFRCKYSWWDDDDNKVILETGFIAANSYASAARKITAICTNSAGECDLVEMNLYEVDNYNCGLLHDNDIKEIYEAEKKGDN